jgi:phosphoribosylglycinamide formyltransferase-1
MERIGLITYYYPHLKTEQVVQNLVKMPYKLKMYALPYKPRKERVTLFQHRPDQIGAAATEVIAEKHRIPYVRCEGDSGIDDSCDLYLICGAGILSAEAIKGKRIINCHPGIIPASRGLDAFKWAVYDMKPLGITLHYIDEDTDAGELISVIPTNVYKTDSIATLARRHYENEIYCTANFMEYLRNPQNPYKGLEKTAAKKRMPLEKEKELLIMFEKYTEKYGGGEWGVQGSARQGVDWTR